MISSGEVKGESSGLYATPPEDSFDYSYFTVATSNSLDELNKSNEDHSFQKVSDSGPECFVSRIYFYILISKVC